VLILLSEIMLQFTGMCSNFIPEKAEGDAV
jgi:hypothetical protein